jgi:carbonic anhydrase/acetyltransferase-like protein (isoleucine patch superfamily)
VHESAYVAPTATICGDVTLEENARILFGTVIVAEGGPVVIGANCIIMENAIIRGTPKHPCQLKNNILVGPRSYLSGCTIEENVFLATGSTIFNGARIGARSEVRINGVVHLQTLILPDTTVPIGWIAIGNPAQILPPNEHEKIWSLQEPLNFPKEVFGVDRASAGETNMPELTRRYARALEAHKRDRIIDTDIEMK